MRVNNGPALSSCYLNYTTARVVEFVSGYTVSQFVSNRQESRDGLLRTCRQLRHRQYLITCCLFTVPINHYGHTVQNTDQQQSLPQGPLQGPSHLRAEDHHTRAECSRTDTKQSNCFHTCLCFQHSQSRLLWQNRFYFLLKTHNYSTCGLLQN